MTKHDPFIMLPHTVYDSPAFAALDPIHITVLLLLMRKHNGHNNGSIALGVRPNLNSWRGDGLSN